MAGERNHSKKGFAEVTKMNQLTTEVSARPATTEPVAEAIREHETSAEDWQFHGIAARLNHLFDQLNSAFFNGCLPKAVIAIGPDLIVRYGYYRIGRDEIGAKHRIQLNARHFGRSESDVAVTLLHEMLHVYQHLYGVPAQRARYHNKEFCRMALTVGIEAEIDSGRTKAVSHNLRETLRTMGFSEEKALIQGVSDAPIQRPVRKVMWQCECGQEIWVERDTPARAVCQLCHAVFERAA